MLTQLAAILLAGAPAAATPPDGWRTYANVRFAFSVCYPSGLFRAGRPPDNGDGLSFSARDGAEFSASGMNDAMETGLAGEQRSADEDLSQISYRARGKDWFVVSGLKGNRIIYEKTFFAEERFVTLLISYPRALAAKYAPITARMSRCLRYDRRPF